MSILRRGFALAVVLVAASGSAAYGQTRAYPALQQQTLKLSGSGATGSAQQGAAVAISADGNTAVVGGPADNSNVGGAWIFVRNGSTWTQQGNELIGTGAAGAAQMGTAVGISGDGNTVILGGPFDNSSAGAAWVFMRTAGAWSQQGSKLLGSGAVGGANQGRAVAISADGNTAIVGGPGNDGGDGGVWIFSRSGSTWSQQGAKLLGSGIAGDGDNEGGAVAISGDGNTILFGSAFDNGNAGAFWFFTRSGITWTQLGSKMVGTGATGAAQQGTAVALSADGLVAAIGGPANNSSAGAVWIFTRSAGTWTQQSLLTAAATDASGAAQLGTSMGISGDGAVIAAGGIGDNSNQGAVFVFNRTSVTSWAELGPKLVASDASVTAKFGSGAAISGDGNSGIFGANADTSSAGAIWPYNSNIFFGGAAVGSPVVQTITVEAQNGFTVGTTPGMIVVTQGAANLDFTLAASQPSSNACQNGGAFQGQFKTCSVNIQFNPMAAGIRQGAIQFYNNDGNTLGATVYFYGVGLAALVGFGPELIETVAGNGTSGYSGDTGPAPAAELDTPYGVSLDAADNLYIADYGNAIVRMVNPQTDTITRIAGTPDVTGSTGNGGLATSAKFDLPETPILDGAGNLFIMDIYNCELREVSPQTGIISAYAGNTTEGYQGDGGLASSAEIYASYQATVGNNGDLYIADTYNNVVRRVSAITGIITTVAGTGTRSYSGDGGPATSATFNHIAAVVMDAAGNLYISDDENYVIREVAAGTITTIVGNADTNSGGFSGDGGPATSAQIYDAEGLALDPAGNLYITDSSNNAVREVSAATGIINSIAGDGTAESGGYTGDDGPATAALLNYPTQPAMDVFGDLFFGDYSNNVVRIIGSVAPLSFGSVNVGSASAAQDVTVSNNGTATLTFTSIAASTNFNLDGADTTCTSSTQLAPGQSCVLGVEFAPGTGGALSGSVTLLDNSRFTSQTIGLTGTGVPVTPAITLTAQPQSANENQSVLFTAVLNPVPVTPFGTINFCDITNQSVVARRAGLAHGRPSPTPADGIFANCDGGTRLGAGNVDETGTATFATTGLSPETHMIIAVYSGNAGLNEALSNTVPVTVSSLLNTTTTLSANPNPAGTGQTVTFTALVSGPPTGSPLGSVSFCLGSLDVGTRLAASPAAAALRSGRRPVFTPDGPSGPCGPATLLSTVNIDNTGTAMFATSSLSLGTNIITAIYSGNTNFASSISNGINEVINSGVTTTTTLSANPNPAGMGQSVTFTALVSPAPTGSPLGSVSFCLGSLDGSTRLAASASAAGARATRGAGFTRDGNPDLCDGATLLSTVNLDNSGSAMFATSSLAVGTNLITAFYSGNAGSAFSASNSISEIINSTVATTTTLAASPNPANAGQAVTLTATVAPVPTGSPLGSVTFCLGGDNDASRMVGVRARTSGVGAGGQRNLSASPAEESACGSGTSLNMANVDSTGTATFTSSSLSSGSLMLTAVYSGNAGSDGSTSDPVTEVINPAFTVTASQTPFDVGEDGSVQIPVDVPPLGGSFTNLVTLSATGLPPGATATFNPATVTPGAAGAQTVMTVVLAGGKSSASRMPSAPPAGPAGRIAGVFAALCLMAGILAAGSRAPARRRLAALVIFFTAVSGSALLLSACSGGFAGGAVTPKGAYVITVTGTSGSLQASTTVNLVVE